MILCLRSNQVEKIRIWSAGKRTRRQRKRGQDGKGKGNERAAASYKSGRIMLRIIVGRWKNKGDGEKTKNFRKIKKVTKIIEGGGKSIKRFIVIIIGRACVNYRVRKSPFV